MKSCDLIRDLIPLYAEELTSEESTALVKEHLASCTDCQSYYQMVQQDIRTQKVQQTSHQPQELIAKLAQYQSKIKQVGIYIAMLLSCIVAGANIELLSTLPLIIIVPFICRLYYQRSMPIILSVIPFAMLGSFLSENDISYVPFFTVFALISASIGVAASLLVKQAFKQWNKFMKVILITLASVLIILSSGAYFSMWGTPVGYVQTFIQTREYVKQTYEPGTLTFKGIRYNFKNNRHYARYEYVLNGSRQVAIIEPVKAGIVYDDYQFILETRFSEERAADLKNDISPAIGSTPVYITAAPISALDITRNELDEMYYHLSYDIPRRDLATQLRQQASSKLEFHISFGIFSSEKLQLEKDAFLQYSIAIRNVLEQRQVPFYSIELQAAAASGKLQSVQFTPQSSEQDLVQSYRTITEK